MLVAGLRPSQIAAIVGNPAERVPAAIMSTARAGKACLLVPRRAAQRSRDAKMAAGLSRWESERWKAACQGTLQFSSVRLVVPSEILTWDDVLMYAGRFFSTTTGNTETAAGYIAAETGLDAVRSCSARTVDSKRSSGLSALLQAFVGCARRWISGTCRATTSRRVTRSSSARRPGTRARTRSGAARCREGCVWESCLSLCHGLGSVAERSEVPHGMDLETAASIGVALPKSFRVPMMAYMM